MPTNVDGDSLANVVVLPDSTVTPNAGLATPAVRIGTLVDRYRRAWLRPYSGTSLTLPES